MFMFVLNGCRFITFRVLKYVAQRARGRLHATDAHERYTVSGEPVDSSSGSGVDHWPMEGSNRNQLYQIHRRRSRAPGTMRVLLFASMCQASLVHSTASSASCSNDFTTGVEHTSQCSPLADVTHQYDHPSHRQRHRHRHKQVQSQLCFVGARHCFALQPRHGSGSSGGSSKENTCFRTGTSTARCSRKSKLSMGGKSSRGAGKPTGRPASRNGVGKKVRRILEPASPAEVREYTLHFPYRLVTRMSSYVTVGVSHFPEVHRSTAVP